MDNSASPRPATPRLGLPQHVLHRTTSVCVNPLSDKAAFEEPSLCEPVPLEGFQGLGTASSPYLLTTKRKRANAEDPILPPGPTVLRRSRKVTFPDDVSNVFDDVSGEDLHSVGKDCGPHKGFTCRCWACYEDIEDCECNSPNWRQALKPVIGLPAWSEEEHRVAGVLKEMAGEETVWQGTTVAPWLNCKTISKPWEGEEEGKREDTHIAQVGHPDYCINRLQCDCCNVADDQWVPAALYSKYLAEGYLCPGCVDIAMAEDEEEEEEDDPEAEDLLGDLLIKNYDTTTTSIDFSAEDDEFTGLNNQEMED